MGMLRKASDSKSQKINCKSTKSLIVEKVSKYFSTRRKKQGQKDCIPTSKCCPLPPEIIELVIDELQDSRSSLISCSLVCHSWLPRSRYHLFRHVTLDLRDIILDDLEVYTFMEQILLRTTNFRTTIYDNEAIVPVVRGLTLRFNFGYGYAWDNQGLSLPFTNLRYLHVDYYGMHADNSPALVAILKKNPSLEHLVIENDHFHSQFVSNLLTSLSKYTPRLSALTLKGIRIGGSFLDAALFHASTSQNCPDDWTVTSPIHLERLYIEDCEEEVLVEILSSPQLVDLTQLRFFGLRPRFWTSLSSSTCEMIKNMDFGSQLTHLALGVYTYIHEMGAGTTWISPCQNVTHLQLIGDTRYRALARVSMLLCLLPVLGGFNKLEHLHISDSPFLIYHRALDNLLHVVSKSLPSLNRISVGSSNRKGEVKPSRKATNRFTLAVRLPRTAASGVLDGGKLREWWLEPKW